ncbi:polysaccharide deacetylase family protein [Streptomyces sp. B-S-A8]|uniref:Polysaccharide deacetylase family protein n=1 Tax=Streptomyces solicavernae TaxID=3043614 RepID=A0ABT6S0H9_9ACTN|nr:polysaccharide deacetylase family protein [Streptomyces sp. B-S-A8]MDI3389483.1 polysaccharide deacetylase family protein [Streptomyces sp. B-S-A8]
MTVPVRRLAALGVLAAVTAGCGTGQDSAPDPDRPSAPASPRASADARPPTLAPGPEGLAPVFKSGKRDGGKTVALTFDADMTADQGPRAAKGERFDNPELIATLRRLKVPSTVFMTGRWAEEYPDQARAIDADPLFEVANHSYSHYAFTSHCYGLPTIAPEKMRADVERAFRAFEKVGVENAMPYFRFPGGCYDRSALRNVAQAGVTAVQWDVVSGDAFATDADAVAEEVLRGVRPGSVVVLHCTRSAAPTTERVVRKVVPELRERGYRFVRVSELIRAQGAEEAPGRPSGGSAAAPSRTP